VIDLTIAVPAVAREITDWAIDEDYLTGSDHEVVPFNIVTLYPDAKYTHTHACLNWHKKDWDTFASTLQTLLDATKGCWSLLQQDPTPEHLNEWATILRDSIQTAAEISTPTLKPTPRSKRWWMAELEATHKAMTRAQQWWKRTCWPEDHDEFKCLHNTHFCSIRYIKDTLWKEYLSQAEGVDM
jgi:hypothetical protein